MTLRYAHVGDREVEAAAERVGAAAAAVATGVVEILGVVLDTDQFIAATHVAAILAIGFAQVWIVMRGINAMERSGQRRADEHDRRHRQTMDDQQKRHEEFMKVLDKRHEETMDDRKRRHEQAMAAHRQSMADRNQRHEEAMAAQRESMEALKALIRRTEPRPAES